MKRLIVLVLCLPLFGCTFHIHIMGKYYAETQGSSTTEITLPEFVIDEPIEND